MARLLPIQGETEVPDSGPRVVDLEGEDADAVFSALSSDTARDIYRSLQEEPHTPSEVAEAADTSIQNVRYHLDNLEDAGLIEVVDTWYSSRGNEMSVYAPTSDALVLASGEEQTSRLKTALSRLVSGVVVLALASLAFQRAAKSLVGGKIGLGGGSPQGSGAAEEPGSYEFATDGGDGGGGGAGGGTGGTNGSERAAADGTTTDSGDLNVMSGDSTTATPADTQTATEATPQPTAEPTQAATTVAEEPTAEATRTATEAATGTQTPMATGTPTAEPATTAEPETTRTVVESAANTTLDQTVRETTTAMASDPTVTTTVADGARTGNDALQAGGLPPGLVFFAGGAIVLVAVVGYLYWKGA